MDTFMWGVLAGVWLMIGVFSISDYGVWRDEVQFAIEECEQELPRNLHCEPVITAKVVEEE